MKFKKLIYSLVLLLGIGVTFINIPQPKNIETKAAENTYRKTLTVERAMAFDQDLGGWYLGLNKDKIEEYGCSITSIFSFTKFSVTFTACDIYVGALSITEDYLLPVDAGKIISAPSASGSNYSTAYDWCYFYKDELLPGTLSFAEAFYCQVDISNWYAIFNPTLIRDGIVEDKNVNFSNRERTVNFICNGYNRNEISYFEGNTQGPFDPYIANTFVIEKGIVKNTIYHLPSHYGKLALDQNINVDLVVFASSMPEDKTSSIDDAYIKNYFSTYLYWSGNSAGFSTVLLENEKTAALNIKSIYSLNSVNLYDTLNKSIDCNVKLLIGSGSYHIAPASTLTSGGKYRYIFDITLLTNDNRLFTLKLTALNNYGSIEVLDRTKLETPAFSSYNYINDYIYYTPTFTSINNAVSYEIFYYKVDGTYIDKEISTSNILKLTKYKEFATGVYHVKCRALGGGFYLDSDISTTFAQITVNQPVVKNGIILQNLTPNMNSWTMYDDPDGKIINDYDTFGFYRNIYSSSTGNYSYNAGVAYEANKKLSPGTYYVSVNYKFNEDISTKFAYFKLNLTGVKYYNGVPVSFENPSTTTHLENGQPVTTFHREGRLSAVFTIKTTQTLEKVWLNYDSITNIPQNENVYISHSFSDFMLFNLTESYQNDLYLPSQENMDKFIDNIGYIDYVQFDDNYIFGPKTLYTSCTQNLTSTQILNNYTNLYNAQMFIKDNNYSLNQSKPGTYTVTIAYYDYLNVLRTLTINIVVKDDVAPTISITDGGSRITSYLSAPLSIAEIIDKLTVTDNYDGNLKSSLTYDATTYLANKNNPGTYTIAFQVSDSSGNVGYKTIYIDVVNDLGPVFEAPLVIYKSTDIVFNSNDVLKTINKVTDQTGTILQLFNGSGKLDDTHFKLVQDTFTGSANKVGTYAIKLKATDDLNRNSFHTFTIHVVKNIPNLVYYNKTIFVAVDTKLSNDQLISLANKFGLTTHNKSDSIVTFITNEYEENLYAAGQSYQIKIRYVAADGTEDNVSLTIKVSEGETQAIKSLKWYDKVWNFIKTWWWVALGAILLIGGIAVYQNHKPKTRSRGR